MILILIFRPKIFTIMIRYFVELSFLIKLTASIAVFSCDTFVSNNYDPSISPSGNSTEVLFGYRILGLDEISIRSNLFTLQLRINMEWTDIRLLGSKKLAPYLNLTLDRRGVDCFWRPKCSMVTLRSLKVTDDDVNRVVFIVSRYAGRFIWIQTSDLTVHCDMDIAWYPMDIQHCSLTFISWNTDKMHLKWSPLKNDRKVRNQYSYDVESSIKRVNCSRRRQSSCFETSFVFRRRFKLYLMTVYFPSCLIVLTSFISFWIDPHAVPARVTLSITSLLALMTQMISVRNSIPNVNYVTAIDVWFLVCTSFVSLSMFEYALIHSLIKKSIQDERRTNPVILFSARHQQKKKKKKESNWNIDSLSKIAFPLFFSTYIMIYVLVFSFIAPK